MYYVKYYTPPIIETLKYSIEVENSNTILVYPNFPYSIENIEKEVFNSILRTLFLLEISPTKIILDIKYQSLFGGYDLPIDLKRAMKIIKALQVEVEDYFKEFKPLPNLPSLH